MSDGISITIKGSPRVIGSRTSRLDSVLYFLIGQLETCGVTVEPGEEHESMRSLHLTESMPTHLFGTKV